MSKRKRSGELFDDDDDAVGTLRVNPQFATKFQERKEAEELSRLKDKYGRDALKVHADDGSSSSETEDEDAEADTKARSTEFLRTLSLIKARDKRVFDKNAQFYSPEGDDETPKRGKKAEKPMYLRDHERTRLLSKGAMAFVNDDDDDGDNQQPAPGSYAHEQAAIKASFAHAVSDDDDSDDEESGGFLKLRSKSQHEQDQEDDDYVRWLQGDGAALVADPETAQDLEPLKRFWTDPNLDEGDRFLRDYITRQMWKDEPAGPVTVARLGVRSADVDDDEDVQAVEEMEEYERAYNFRFEEADGTTIKQHPRNVGSSLRQKDTKRKEARQRKAERREEVGCLQQCAPDFHTHGAVHDEPPVVVCAHRANLVNATLETGKSSKGRGTSAVEKPQAKGNATKVATNPRNCWSARQIVGWFAGRRGRL
eukprot:m.288388 g.288388  ORF g.288388 m.288388 type:complete len:424 (-) comp19449_c0_seq21:2790-4061(-)